MPGVNYSQPDPMGGMNQGLANLGRAIQYRQQADRQLRLDSMNEQNQGLQRTLSQMGIDKMRAEQEALIQSESTPEAPVKNYAEAMAAAKKREKAAKEQQFWFQEKMKFIEPLFKGMIENGDNEGLGKLFTAYGADPHIGPLVKNLKTSGYTVTGKGETEVTAPFTKEQLTAFIPQAKDDVIKTAISTAQPGNYQVKMKGGKVVGFAPVKPPVTAVKVYGADGKLVRETYPKADGTFDLKEGETTTAKDPNASQTREQLTARALKGDKEAKAILDAMDKRELEAARTKAAITDPQNKPKRVPYRDTVTGAINYYDVNNPADRATLQKFGAQLQAVAENPMAPVIRESLTAQPGKSAYKTADEVKAAYKAGKLGEKEATAILQKDFGYK